MRVGRNQIMSCKSRYMLRTALLLSIVALFPLVVFGQSPMPTPPADDYVVKITTSLIRLDVTVTDKKGNPVSDLTPDEVEIYENGKKQEITQFRYVSSRPADLAELEAAAEGIPVPRPVGRLSDQNIRRTIALVVDDLSLSFESTHFVRRALRNFVETQMQEGDLVAIIRTEGGMGALQQFTSNKEQLYAAIEKVKWNLRGRARVGAFLPIDGSEPEPEGDGRIVNDESDVDEYREDLFATGTLGALNFIVRGMRDLPGRKSVMLLSDGFLLFRKNSRGFVESTRLLTGMERLVDLANRSSVVIYTTDARGLQTANFTAADSMSGQNGVFINRALSDRRFELNQTQDALIYMAENTGGLSFRNNNSIRRAIGGMLDDQSYYLVGYEPDDEIFDPEKRRFNKISVKVSRPDSEVRYRSGFFGITDEEVKAPKENMTNDERILDALVSPFARNEINLSLHTVYKGARKKDLSVGSYLHIDLRDVRFVEQPNGNKTAAFDLLVMNFGDNGVPLGNFSKTFTADLSPERYERLLKEGLVYSFNLPVEKPGAYLVRIAVRDHSTQRVGSANQFIKVPDPGKNDLILSGIVVNNISYEQWNSGSGANPVRSDTEGWEDATGYDAAANTALRRFASGSVLLYALDCYNAGRKKNDPVKLLVRTRLVRDGRVIYEGKDAPPGAAAESSDGGVPVVGALNLPDSLEPGAYALQVIVTDETRKKGGRFASAFVEFELVRGSPAASGIR
ncbi:MAG TPA: VWA domain-containing protein [Aridibacter sp.]|nr:VWA domain-containing protein [Aridibacter sp.]